MAGDQRHRLSSEATRLSIYDNLYSAARNHECLVFETTDGGQLFAQNGFLDIDVKVEKYSEQNFEICDECMRARFHDYMNVLICSFASLFFYTPVSRDRRFLLFFAAI